MTECFVLRSLCLTIFCALSFTKAELFSSICKLENAMAIYKMDREKIEFLWDSIAPEHKGQYQQHNLKILNAYTNSTNALANPVCAFDWMYKMSQIAMMMHNNIFSTYFAHRNKFFATKRDVQGSAFSILLLQWLYDVPTKDVVAGEFLNVTGRLPAPLTSPQMVFVADEAAHYGFKKLEFSWLLIAYENQAAQYSLKVLQRIWQQCISMNLYDLATTISQYINVNFGYHFTATLANRRPWIPNLRNICLNLKALETRVEDIPDTLHLSDSDAVDAEALAHLDYCRQDIVHYENEEPIVRSGMCQWSVPSPFYTIGPLKEEVLSHNPEIKLWHDFLHDSEIKIMLNFSCDVLIPSGIGFPGNERISFFRTSQKHFISWPDKLYNILDKRISAATGLFVETPRSSEHYQINNYGIGGTYQPHYDSEGAFRYATLMVYLTDVALGGDTIFPVLKTAITPRRGTAVIWHNLRRNGETHGRTVHAGCPVVSGNKWVVNKWINYDDQFKTRPCGLRPLDI